MTDPFIQTRDLCVDFPLSGHGRRPESEGEGPASAGRIVTHRGRAYVRALDHVNFTLTPGERLGIWGKNGSGKSTLLRVLRGIYPPTSGSLVLQGQSQSFFNLSFGFNPNATGYENILLRGVIMGATPGQMKELTPEIAQLSGLGDFLNLPLHTYSSGMRMRLAFSVAMSLPADLLLMDEWLSVGDVDYRQKAADKLKEVVQASKILVIASHNKRLLEGVCTRIITLNEGRIAEDRPVTVKCDKIPFWDAEQAATA